MGCILSTSLEKPLIKLLAKPVPEGLEIQLPWL